jgi:peptide/nickel transport system substrate-binding protein
VRYAKGDRIGLARNDAYWGGKTPTKVTLRSRRRMRRVAALLSGDVQVIENCAHDRRRQAKTDKRLAVYRTVADRLIFLHMDSDRDVSPMVTDKEGKLAKNPLKDPRAQGDVEGDQPRGHRRQGRSTACRQAARRRLSVRRDEEPEGRALRPAGAGAAGQPAIRTASGRPSMLRTTGMSTTPRSRRLWRRCSRARHDTKVVAMPSSTFFTQATNLKFSFMLVGWSTGTGEASSSLKR